MRAEACFVCHVGGFGDIETEVEVTALSSAAEFDLAQDGVRAEAEQLERWIEEAIDSGERFTAGVGDRNGHKVIGVPVAKLERIAASIGQEFGVGMLVEWPVVSGQAAAIAMKVEKSHPGAINDWRTNLDGQVGVTAALHASLSGIWPKFFDVQANGLARTAVRALCAVQKHATAAIALG